MSRKSITRHNVDIYNAVDVIRRIDEAPYKMGMDRATDWLKSKFGGDISKGQHDTGKLANELSGQWKQFLGKQGITDVNKAPGASLLRFIEMYAGQNFELPRSQTGRVANTILHRIRSRPTDEVPEADQDKVLIGIAGGMASLKGTDEDDVDHHPVGGDRSNVAPGGQRTPPGNTPPKIPGIVTSIGIDLLDNDVINLLDGMAARVGISRGGDTPDLAHFTTGSNNHLAIAVFRGLVLSKLGENET